MHLTKGMLNAMLTALSELLAGEGPQGVSTDADIDECFKIMQQAEKAHAWIHQELEKRHLRSKATKNGKQSLYFKKPDRPVS